MESTEIASLLDLYGNIREDIETRLGEFQTKWEEGDDNDIFAELTFCLLTPQSKAKVCWPAVESMVVDNSLFSGNREEILAHVNHIRFKNNKTAYILLARELFTINNKINIKKTILNLGQPIEAREWLVENVKGLGYKESSHFLRNIGMGEDLAILDRHILRNLVAFGVIKEMPTSITPKKYLEIEERMRRFSKEVNIPMDHLDLLFWYKVAGELYK